MWSDSTEDTMREFDVNNVSMEVSKALDQLAAEHLQFVVKLGSDSTPPAELFHYTDADGLFGIVTKNCLWAGNVRFLNDESELEYGIALAKAALEAAAGKTAGSNSHRFLKQEAEIRLSILRHLWHIYAFSTSAIGDQLSQWRAYGGGGMGYSIGFDTAGLRALRYHGSAKTPMLMRICYCLLYTSDAADE